MKHWVLKVYITFIFVCRGGGGGGSCATSRAWRSEENVQESALLPCGTQGLKSGFQARHFYPTSHLANLGDLLKKKNALMIE